MWTSPRRKWYDGYNAVGDMIDLLEGGRLAKRAGRRHPTIYPWVIMPVKDGHFSMITTQKRHWDRFVELMGSPDWAADPRYQDLRKVGARYPEELNALIEPWVSSHSKWDIWKTCRENKIPFQPVQTSADMLDSEHLHARGFWAPGRAPRGWPPNSRRRPSADVRNTLGPPMPGASAGPA